MSADPLSRLAADAQLTQRQPSPLTLPLDSDSLLPLASGSATPTTPHGHPLTAPRRVARHTPLPMLKIMPLCISRMAEGMIYAVIFPYINEMIADFGVPEHSVADNEESTLMVTEAIAAPIYAPFADRVGRKTLFVPILVMWGIFAVGFGFASNPWSTVLWRAALGTLAGAGVLSRTMVGEMCDKSNRMRGFAIFSPSLTVGVTLAPLIGGFLAHPVPRLLPPSFSLFTHYPYLLPALVTGLAGFAAALTSFVFLPETLPPSMRKQRARGASEKPSHSALRTLLTYPKFQRVLVLYGLNNSVMFTWEALYPLFAFTPQESGGLGLDTIGVVLAFGALLSIVMTVFLFPRLHDAIPEDKLLYMCLVAYPAAVLLFPVLWAVHHGTTGTGMRAAAWAVLAVQMVMRRTGDFAATMLDVCVMDALPSPDFLAMANSITFSAAAACRATGPFIISSFFAVSTTYASPTSPGRLLVWVVFILISLPSIYLASTVSDVRPSKEGHDEIERHELLPREAES